MKKKNTTKPEQGKIPIWRFKNIIKSAMKIKDFDWAENFMEKQSHKLDKVDKIPILEYSKALILFTKGDYTNAFLELNNKPYSKDPFIKIDIILLFLYIALYLRDKEEIDFERHKENLRSIINSNAKKKSEFVINKWRLALKWIGKTYPIRDKKELRNLKEEIHNEAYFPGKNWLLDFIGL